MTIRIPAPSDDAWIRSPHESELRNLLDKANPECVLRADFVPAEGYRQSAILIFLEPIDVDTATLVMQHLIAHQLPPETMVELETDAAGMSFTIGEVSSRE